MKYIIEITETLQKQIEVEAQNESQAIKLIKEKYKNEEIILTEQDFIDYETDIIKQSIYIDDELDKNSICAKNAHMGKLGLQIYSVNYYNFDMIISVGYRVKSKRGIIFRRWANKVLKFNFVQQENMIIYYR